MRILISILLSMTLLAVEPAIAHSDHDSLEPRLISGDVAIIIAQRATTSMSQKDAGLGFGQLHESWSTIPREDLSVYKKGRGYYVIAVVNQNEDKTLYVLMSNLGEVYDANLVGEFEGIK